LKNGGMSAQKNQLSNMMKKACGNRNSLDFKVLEMKAMELEEEAKILEQNVEEFE
jgi:hypothetical protein